MAIHTQIKKLLHSTKEVWAQFLTMYRSMNSKQKNKIKSQQLSKESENLYIEFELKNQLIKYEQLLFRELKTILYGLDLTEIGE